MSTEIKIDSLEIENVKRVKAVALKPTAEGLTVIGGKNNQGKTSLTTAIVWALGGDKYRPSEPRRDGSILPPYIHIELSNGFIVERKGKNSDLKVIDPSGNKAGQGLLNEFISQFALDLPKFMEANGKEKAKTLLQIIGVGEELYRLEKEEQEIYNRRYEIGRIADQKKKYAEELVSYPEAPKAPVSALELIQKQQEILARNGENQRKRQNLDNLRLEYKTIGERVKDLKEQLARLTRQQDALYADIETAQKDTLDLLDESTTELEKSISDIDEINRKVRTNMDKEKAEAEASDYEAQYTDLSEQLTGVRKAKTDLLEGADLPLEGLSVKDGELTYKGYKWDNMSGSDQLKVSTAIVRKLNPQCGFVLLDKLEQMDLDTLQDFDDWLKKEGLQAIATRVSTGEECSIIIEDGYVAGAEQENVPKPKATGWKAGEF